MSLALQRDKINIGWLILEKLETEMYIEVTKYLFKAYTSQELPKYVNSQLFTTLIRHIYNNII